MQPKNKISITETIKNALAKGYKIPIESRPDHSELKKITSLIGMAYLNYIYQNDIENQHFCESMLLMNSQIPEGTDNLYIHLFELEMASNTMPILEDIQLSFDYSIARTNPPVEKIQASIANIQAALKKYKSPR